MITLDEAKRFVLEGLVALEPVEVALAEALGCVVAEHVVARESIPGFTNSSMDGFALRADDTISGSARLAVVDAVMAGDVSAVRVHAGEATRIMTGAPLPDGADAVCMIEETIVENPTTVRISRVVARGEYVRYPGDDVKAGELLVSPGTELNATSVAVLAGQGRTSVLVHARPRVGVLSTGNELARSSDPLEPGQIRDSNRPLLLALLRQSGFTAIDLGIAQDSHDDILRCLTVGVSTCDAVISTGGVSVGDVDHVKTVIGELGGDDARSMRVAIKPGKPFAFGNVGPRRTPVFGLPGNPVSTRVSFEMFVRPALRALAGHSTLERLTIPAVLDVALARQPDGRLHLVHVTARIHDDGVVHVRSTARQGSHLLNAVVDANAIAYVPAGVPSDVGDIVQVLVLDADDLAARR